MTAPQARPGCPAWCTDHDDEYGQHVSAYMYLGKYPAARIGVALRQGETLETPTLYVGGVAIDTGRVLAAGSMATLMRDLGHEDIAAAIEELAALAAGQDGAK